MAAEIMLPELFGRRIEIGPGGNHVDVLHSRFSEPAEEGRGVSLDLPDVRQSTEYSCGRAALLSALRFLGVPADLNDLGTDPNDGTRPGEITAACRAIGLDVVAGSFAEVAGVRGLIRYLDRRIPILCPIQADDPDGNSSGHWVVVCGYDGQNGAQLALQDPVRGRVEMPAKEFEARWHDSDADGRRFVRYGIAVSRPPLREEAGKGGRDTDQEAGIMTRNRYQPKQGSHAT